MAILNIPHICVKINNKPIVVEGQMVIDKGDVVLLTGPNGCGKSTIIKIIMGDTFEYKKLDTDDMEILFCNENSEIDILASEENMEFFRRNVCYVSQGDLFESESLLDCFLMSLNYCNVTNKERYVYEFVKNFSLHNCFNMDLQGEKLGRKGQRLARKIGAKINELSEEERNIIKFLSIKTTRLSGGQKKMANIITNLVKSQFCSLIIIDEPLNNLDYNNVRIFSNILTQLHHQYSDIGILVVTHCRSIPIINKVYEISIKSKSLNFGEKYHCNSCFGNIDENLMYL